MEWDERQPNIVVAVEKLALYRSIMLIHLRIVKRLGMILFSVHQLHIKTIDFLCAFAVINKRETYTNNTQGLDDNAMCFI